MDAVETQAAYLAVIRHELQLPRGTDALLALELRLTPADARQRPPARAPGIARLARGLRRLRQQKAPADSIEQFSDDLRFLRIFDDDAAAWTPKVLDDLLANVIVADPIRQARRAPASDDAPKTSPAKRVVKFRPSGRASKGDV